MTVNSLPFQGVGQFKFALVGSNGATIYWLSSPDGGGGVPSLPITNAVVRGLYSVALGDTNLRNMAALPVSVFSNRVASPSPAPLLLRTWFNDGTSGFQQLSPDQPLEAVPFSAAALYSQLAAGVPTGAITAEMLGTNAVQSLIAAITPRLDAMSAQIAGVTNQVNTLLGSGLSLASSDPADPVLASMGLVSFYHLPEAGWVEGAALNAPSPRSNVAGAWTGQQFFLWGGEVGVAIYASSGALYDPSGDQWQLVSTLNPPTARKSHSILWDGSEAIVWGGFSYSGYLSSGGRYNPNSQIWTPTSTVGVPAARDGHIAVWTTSRMLVWGGRNNSGLRNDGALYDPIQDSWLTLTNANPPTAAKNAAGVWAGDRFLVWGGRGPFGDLASGAQLRFSDSTSPTQWVTFSTSGAPSPRSLHTAVWTGQRLLVWGGSSDGTALGDGAGYDPVLDTWTPISSTNAPAARFGHSAIWTGQEMVVFGGESGAGSLASGGAYNPATGKWRALTSSGTPIARSGAAAVWSGTEILIFGGVSNGSPVAALQRLNPQPAWYLYRKP